MAFGSAEYIVLCERIPGSEKSLGPLQALFDLTCRQLIDEPLQLRANKECQNFAKQSEAVQK